MKTLILAKLFDTTVQTINRHKKDKKKYINLIQKYFTEEEIEEFLINSKIEKFELVKNLDINELKNILNNVKIGKIFDKKMLNLKLSTLSNPAKQLLIDQLEYCIKTKQDYTLSIAKSYYNNQFKQSITLFKNIFNENTVPSYSQKDRKKFIFFIENILNEDDIFYINSNKQNIIEVLHLIKGWFPYSSS